MRQYLAILFLIIMITACAPKVDIERAKPAEEPTAEEPKDIIEQPKLPSPPPAPEEEKYSGVIINIKDGSFDPVNKTINRNVEIKWVNTDKREHKIACYLSGNRVTTSSNLKKGDYFTYTFIENGGYTCIDAIYGLRGHIEVEGAQALLSPTGNVILNIGGNFTESSIASTAIISMIILLFFIYGRKRK